MHFVCFGCCLLLLAAAACCCCCLLLQHTHSADGITHFALQDEKDMECAILAERLRSEQDAAAHAHHRFERQLGLAERDSATAEAGLHAELSAAQQATQAAEARAATATARAEESLREATALTQRLAETQVCNCLCTSDLRGQVVVSCLPLWALDTHTACIGEEPRRGWS